MPHSTEGVHRRPPRTKKRLLMVHSVRWPSAFSMIPSNARARVASCLARILFRKFRDLICGESSGEVPPDLEDRQAHAVLEEVRRIGCKRLARMTAVGR